MALSEEIENFTMILDGDFFLKQTFNRRNNYLALYLHSMDYIVIYF